MDSKAIAEAQSILGGKTLEPVSFSYCIDGETIIHVNQKDIENRKRIVESFKREWRASHEH